MARRRMSTANGFVHLAAWIPLAVLVFDFFTGGLTVNPIQDITQRTGKTALILLVASLACTPLVTMTGWRRALSLRRPVGLYAFLYAVLHFVTFAVIDYGLDWVLLREAIFEKPFALVGFSALMLLLPLAATSWDWWKIKLGVLWKRIHRLVYLAALLVVIHYSWAVKGTLSSLQGNIAQPLLFGGVVVLLLILRIPAVKKSVVRWRYQLRGKFFLPADSS